MRAKWWTGAIALLMGGLVGPYSSISSPPIFALIVSTLALALPALISVLTDPAIQRRLAAVAWVGVTALLLSSLVLAGAVFPAIWQGYRNDAAAISLLAEILLTPLVAAFALGTRAEPGPKAEDWAIICAVLAWVGLGIQNFVLPFIVPFVRSYYAIVVLHAPINRGGLGLGFLPEFFVVAYICVLYVLGFALAGIEGLLGAALRKRLTRPQRFRPSAPLP